jgi:hypothetical protein
LSEDRDPKMMVIEMHEEFIQHMEKGGSIIKTLSSITVVVALLLVGSYAYELASPYFTGTTSVTVNLVDPVLQATEIGLLALGLAWLSIGLRDLVFTRKMSKAIREVRALEKEIEERIGGQPVPAAS